MFGTKKQTLIVEGMMCGHCAAHVQDALCKLEGVKAAKVESDLKTVNVKVSGELSEEVYRAAIEGAGYKLVEVVP
ncbi:MAG: cation transporter [Bacilli bacterium]|nr:cation transporter [Bacilli bacterium]